MIGRCVLRRALVVVLTLLAFGCATTDETGMPDVAGTAPAADSGTSDEVAARWYYLRFQFDRNDDDAVDRYLDLIVANEIIAPVLAAQRDGIRLWRFHRRWPKDPTGHQFSFIVLTDPARLALIDEAIQRQPAFARLDADGRLRRYRVAEASGDTPGALATTSDRSWPEVLQREWPHFIMGASRMWLGLVADEAEQAEGPDLYARYEAASAALDRLWFEEGNHALFHHLSALFGYQPLRVIRRDVMTF